MSSRSPSMARSAISTIAFGSTALPRCSNAPLGSRWRRSEEHTSELQSLMRISYAVFCLKKKKITQYTTTVKNTTMQRDTQETNNNTKTHYTNSILNYMHPQLTYTHITS